MHQSSVVNENGNILGMVSEFGLDVSGIWSEDNAGEKCVPGGCCDGKNWKNTKAGLH